MNKLIIPLLFLSFFLKGCVIDEEPDIIRVYSKTENCECRIDITLNKDAPPVLKISGK